MKTISTHTTENSQPRILLIDHTLSDLDAMGTALRKAGWHVDALSQGADAILMLAGADYDVIVIEAHLSDFESLGLLRICRDRQPYTEVIMTGEQNYDLAIEAVKKGAFQYEPKPLNLTKFLEKVKEAFALRGEAIKMDLTQTAQFTIQEHPLLGCNIVCQLSKSRMGETSFAEKNGKPLVIRRIRLPEDLPDRMAHLDSFLKVVDLVSKLNHKHLTRIFEYGFPEGMENPVLLIEFVKGKDLGVCLAENILSLSERLEIFRQMAAGLSFAHSSGVVHHNIKPSNVLLSEDLKVKLTDFGISLLRDIAGSGSISLRGLPFYSAPECFVVGGNPHAAADIFSLGTIGYELFTGEKAFRGTSMAETAELLKTGKPPAPRSLLPSLPPLVENMLGAMLNKNPDERPQADDLCSALESLKNNSEMLSTIEQHFDTPENRAAWH